MDTKEEVKNVVTDENDVPWDIEENAEAKNSEVLVNSEEDKEKVDWREKRKKTEDKIIKKARIEKFRVIEFVKTLITDTDKFIVNFPNKELELKRRLSETGYDLLQVTYEANITKNVEKKIDLIEKGASYIKVYDFLINRCYDKEIINSKKYFRFGASLDNLVRYYAGWMNQARDELERQKNI